MIEPLLVCEGVGGERDLTRVTRGGGTVEFVDDKGLLGEIFGFIARFSDCCRVFEISFSTIELIVIELVDSDFFCSITASTSSIIMACADSLLSSLIIAFRGSSSLSE